MNDNQTPTRRSTPRSRRTFITNGLRAAAATTVGVGVFSNKWRQGTLREKLNAVETVAIELGAQYSFDQYGAMSKTPIMYRVPAELMALSEAAKKDEKQLLAAIAHVFSSQNANDPSFIGCYEKDGRLMPVIDDGNNELAMLSQALVSGTVRGEAIPARSMAAVGH